MFYFKVGNEIVEKYQVKFNKEEIEKLRENIIYNCSNIVHREYRSDYSPRFIDRNLIRNFHATLVGEKEYFEETRDVYLFSYDEYEPPYLIKLIDRLLKEDTTVLEEILNYEIKSKPSFDKENNLVNPDFLNAKSIYLYYQKLLSLINMELIDTLSLKEIERIESFYTKNPKEQNKILGKSKKII